MKEIKTFEKLFDIQDKKYEDAETGDLFFLRDGWLIVDGCVLMIGADSKYSMELFFISRETLNKFTKGEKQYIQKYYGLKIN